MSNRSTTRNETQQSTVSYSPKKYEKVGVFCFHIISKEVKAIACLTKVVAIKGPNICYKV